MLKLFVAMSLMILICLAADADQTAAPATQPAPSVPFLHVADLQYVYRLTPTIYSGSAPTTAQEFESLQKLGIKTIITVDGSRPNADLAEKYGLRYVHLPVGYDGINRQRQLEIGRAVRDLPGPFYIHCHHGQHRGPTGAVVAAMTVGGWTPQQAVATLHAIGTSPHYEGLYETAADFKKPTNEELNHADCTFPRVAKTPALVDQMVEIDQHWDNLKALRKNEWASMPDHPDIDAPHEGLLLRELFREAHRPGGPAATRPADLIDRLTKVEEQAQLLESALRAGKTSTAGNAAKAIDGACAACHAQYRDRIH